MKNYNFEIEELIVDNSVFQKKESPDYENSIEKPLKRVNFYFIFFSISFLTLLLFLKLFYFQIVKHNFFLNLARKNFERVYLIRPNRGVIYDKDFNQLVFNTQIFDLVCEKDLLYHNNLERKKEIENISEILNINPEDVFQKIKDSKENSILIYENLPKDALINISANIDNFPGFKIEKAIKRDYKLATIFSHLIGYTGKISINELKRLKNYDVSDIVGKSGLEKEYEKILRGTPGKLKIKITAKNQKISEERILDPKDGESLQLYLDSKLQKKIFEILDENLKFWDTNKAAVVVLDAKTGGVLSLLSFPYYDNNLFSKENSKVKIAKIKKLFSNKDSPLLNRAISGEYPPGSTIKPFLALSGLNEKIISPKKTILCKGFIKIKNPWQKGYFVFKDWKAHGLTNLKKAIAQSCDVYFYILGGGYKGSKGLGINRIEKYLSLFGFGKKTNIDLPNEKTGFIPSPEWKQDKLKEPWFLGDTYNISIGQGFLKVTPLQIALGTLSIATDGNIFLPQVVHRIVDSNGNTILENKPKIIGKIDFDKEYFKIVKEGMREAVISGTAHLLSNLKVKVSAKTGTAQIGKEGRFDYWISVFAPSENPEIVLTVLVENAKEKELTPANFIADKILSWYFKQK